MAKVLNMWFFSKIMTQSTLAKRLKVSLKTVNLEVIDWLAQFLNFNPIKFFWSHLKKKPGDSENPLGGITELWERVHKGWNNIPASVCQDLIKSMARSVVAVLSKWRLY